MCLKKLLILLLFWQGLHTVHAQVSEKDSLRAAHYFLKADSLMLLDQHLNSRKFIDEYIAVYKGSKKWQKIIRGNLFLVKNLVALSHFDSALQLCTKNIALNAVQLNDSTYLERLLSQSGIINYRLGRFDKALENFRLSLQVKEAIYNPLADSIALGHNNLGILYKNLGLYVQSRKHLNKAISLYKLSDSIDELLLAKYYNNLGDLYVDLGDLQLGIDFLKQSLHIYEKHKTTNKFTISIVHLSLGTAYSYTGQQDKALMHSKKAHDIALALLVKGHPYLIFTRGSIAEILLNKGRKEDARKLYLENLHLLSEKIAKEHIEHSTFYTNIAITYLPEKPLKALEYFQKAKRLQRKLQGNKGHRIASTLLKIAETYFSMKDYDTAHDYVQQSIYSNTITNDHVKSTMDQQVLLHALKLKGEILAKSNETSDLHLALNQFNLCDSIISIQRHIHQKYDDKIKLGSDAKNIYQKGIETSLKLYQQTKLTSALHNAFRFSERSRGMILLNSFAQKPTGINSTKLDSLRSLKRINQIKTTNLEAAMHNQLLSGNIEESDELQGQILKLRTSNDSIVSTIKRGFPRYHLNENEADVPSINSISNQLITKNQAMVEYFMGDSSLYIMVIRKPESLKITEVKIDSSFYACFNQYRKALSDQNVLKNARSNYYNYTSAAHKLYQYLITPVKDQIESSDLLIIPGDFLSLIPFGPLLTAEAQTEKRDYRTLPYLLKSHNISYANSATILLGHLKDKKCLQNKQKILAFAPIFDDNNRNFSRSTDSLRSTLGPLGWTTAEVKSLGSFYEIEQYAGKDATEKNFRHKATEFSLIHIASHSLVDDENPMYSKIAFSIDENDTINDGYLHTFELYNTPLNAEMVVLSACNTGFGKVQKGEGVISLGYAFAYAGVPSIVVSHWQVDDKSTYLIMKEFYKSLAQGVSKSSALRKAKLTVLLKNSNSAYANPFYWSAFVAYGSDVPISKKSGNFYFLYLVFFAIVFIVLLLWFRRHSNSI